MTDALEATGAALPAPPSSGQAPDPRGPGPDPTRRSFLKAAPLGALAVVTGSAQADAAKAPAAGAAPRTARGYHETEHIRRYYQTAAYW
ncbi:formate dehydrogenase [Massilia sp. DD77]|uniref:formate dehydrogenase n=1 Tax=Massilia sp. DD77 TaxID=3109349 RepID=UPI003000022E